MPRTSASSLESIFIHKKKPTTFIPEVLQASDDSNGFETYQDADTKKVGVRIMTMDGQNEILIPNEQLEGIRYIVNAAIRESLDGTVARRKRRTREEIEAANGNGSTPAGQNPVSNNVMVNLMPDTETDDESEEPNESEELEESKDTELPTIDDEALVGTRRRKR